MACATASVHAARCHLPLFTVGCTSATRVSTDSCIDDRPGKIPLWVLADAWAYSVIVQGKCLLPCAAGTRVTWLGQVLLCFVGHRPGKGHQNTCACCECPSDMLLWWHACNSMYHNDICAVYKASHNIWNLSSHLIALCECVLGVDTPDPPFVHDA